MKKMKYTKICVLLGAMALGSTSCSDMMDINSDRVAFEEDNRLNNANDSIYSVMGILAQVQKVADRCILIGELRGDLDDRPHIRHYRLEADRKLRGNPRQPIR